MFSGVVGEAGPRTAEFSTPDGGSGRYRKILRLCAGDPISPKREFYDDALRYGQDILKKAGVMDDSGKLLWP